MVKKQNELPAKPTFTRISEQALKTAMLPTKPPHQDFDPISVGPESFERKKEMVKHYFQKFNGDVEMVLRQVYPKAWNGEHKARCFQHLYNTILRIMNNEI